MKSMFFIQKVEDDMEPEVSVVITGKVKDFSKIDNVYTVLKREGKKLLEEWKIEIDIKFSESSSPGE